MPRGPGKNCRLTTPGEINPFPIKAALVFEIAVVWLECINNGKFAQRYPATLIGEPLPRLPRYRLLLATFTSNAPANSAGR